MLNVGMCPLNYGVYVCVICLAFHQFLGFSIPVLTYNISTVYWYIYDLCPFTLLAVLSCAAADHVHVRQCVTVCMPEEF